MQPIGIDLIPEDRKKQMELDSQMGEWYRREAYKLAVGRQFGEDE